MSLEKKLISSIPNASPITLNITIHKMGMIDQQYKDHKLKEALKTIEMLEKLIELNMNDLWDIADQRDWYYERYRQLKDKE